MLVSRRHISCSACTLNSLLNTGFRPWYFTILLGHQVCQKVPNSPRGCRTAAYVCRLLVGRTVEASFSLPISLAWPPLLTLFLSLLLASLSQNSWVPYGRTPGASAETYYLIPTEPHLVRTPDPLLQSLSNLLLLKDTMNYSAFIPDLLGRGGSTLCDKCPHCRKKTGLVARQPRLKRGSASNWRVTRRWVWLGLSLWNEEVRGPLMAHPAR